MGYCIVYFEKVATIVVEDCDDYDEAEEIARAKIVREGADFEDKYWTYVGTDHFEPR